MGGPEAAGLVDPLRSSGPPGGPAMLTPPHFATVFGVTVWETVLVFAVLPLALLGLLAVLTFTPGQSRTPRYRVGRPWEHEPVWYVARPDVSAPAGSAAGRAALAEASGHRELPGGVPARAASSVLDARTGTARGGANGEW